MEPKKQEDLELWLWAEIEEMSYTRDSCNIVAEILELLLGKFLE